MGINNEHYFIKSAPIRPDGFQLPPYRQAVYVTGKHNDDNPKFIETKA